MRRFASDPARTLCADAESRVTSWASGDSASGSSPLHRVVPEEALLTGTVVGVLIERQTVVTVNDRLSGVCKERALWPTMKLGDLLRSDDDAVVIGAQKIDPEKTLLAAGLREGDWLTITKIEDLSVSVEKGRACRIFDSPELLAFRFSTFAFRKPAGR